MEREKYLREVWSPYPSMPAGTALFGRIFAIGPQGELTLRRGLQLQSTVLQANELFGVLRVGDLVAISSEGEVLLLAPALSEPLNHPLPENHLRNWSLFLKAVRQFFEAKDFLELFTPQLVPCPGTEPSLDVFATDLVVGSKRRRLYLPTSPELHLKKALSLGFERIFEIAPVFRNGEITPRHQPQFTMLEWYRAYERAETLRLDFKDLVNFLIEEFPQLSLRMPSVVQTSVAELFSQHLGFTLTPQTSLQEYQDLGRSVGLDMRGGDTLDDAFFLIWNERVEPRIDPEVMTFVGEYPPFQAALARLTPQGWGDRFEVYWRGLELANAFHELNDPQVQRIRSEEDLDKKKALGKEIVPLDKEFLKCLEGGMPPSAGIALGLERLFMAMFGVARIEELKLFPISLY